MSVSVTFSDQSANKHSLKVVNKLCQGRFDVYQVHSQSQKADYALKVFPKTSFGLTQYKRETIMFGLSHKNIVQAFPVANISSDSASFANFNGIITEFIKNGDLFDPVANGLFDSEIIIRTYFHQLIEGLDYMHSQGVAHLDLKLENLMLTSDFTLKIIDFDQAQKFTDKKVASAGTKAFRAPEIIDGSCRNMAAADVYSAGVILFAFKGQSTPFTEVVVDEGDGEKCTTLKYYPEFLRENKLFWEIQGVARDNMSFFSKDFKDLINGMLQFEVEKRFTLDDVKKSQWYKGPILDARRLKSEMKAKWEAFYKK